MFDRNGHRAQEEEVNWQRIFEKLREVKKLYQCPFQQFALSHGYDLMDGCRLIFPISAPIFQEEMSAYGRGQPYGGWYNWLPGRFGLPDNVFIKSVENPETGDYYIQYSVQLAKFAQLSHRGLVVSWKTIKKPWPEGSHSMISYEVIPGETVTT